MGTKAADRFMHDIRIAWDTRDPYEATADKGLSETDEDALRDFCAETGEDYQAAEADVLRLVCIHLASTAEVS